MLGGGKRLRPAFAYWGYRGAGGADADAVVAAVAALELVQASALIHDDLMDGSDTRRGEPAVHRRFETPARRGAAGGARRPAFGDSAAMLLGDLAWSGRTSCCTPPGWTRPSWPGPGRSSTRCAPR